jgi:pilus assembly protein FimV
VVEQVAPIVEEFGFDEAGQGERYTVAQDDTMWSIAARSRPEGVSVKDMLAGIQHFNSAQFAGGDMGNVKAGSEIYLPSAYDLMALQQELALAQ